MQQFQRILVPVDVAGWSSGDALPGVAVAALKKAAWIREQSGGEIELLAVVGGSEFVDAARARLEEDVRPVLGPSSAGIHIAVGVPFLEIVRHVLRRGSDLVVLASRKPGLMERSIIGSTAIRVVRKCPCPVWVAGHRSEPGERTVLSAVAFQDLTPQVLALSGQIVSGRGGHWHVLHTMQYPELAGMRLRSAAPDAIAAYESKERAAAWKRLRAMTTPFEKSTGQDIKLWLAEGAPSEQIILAARQLDADVIVMGTIGRGGVPGLLVGNTAEKVLNAAECSVLTVKPDDFVCPIEIDG